MCDQCGPPDPEMVQAYEEFEQAINKFIEKMDRVPNNSVMVDWVLISSRAIMGEHGSATVSGYETSRNQPAYRTTGLLTEVLDYRRSQDTAHIVAHHLSDD